MLDKTGKPYKKASGEPDWLTESEGFLDDLFPSEPDYSAQQEEGAFEGPTTPTAQPETQPQEQPQTAPAAPELSEFNELGLDNLFEEDGSEPAAEEQPAQTEWTRPEWLPKENYIYSDEEKATLQEAFKTDIVQLPPPDLSKVKNLKSGIRYLSSLGDRGEIVAQNVQEAMTMVDSATADRDKEAVKRAAQAAASASINLHTLAKEAENVFGDKDTVGKVRTAVDTMIALIAEEVGSKLSDRGQDFYNKMFDKETMERVRKRKPLTGQYYPEWYINRDLRTIQIMENQGLTEDKALEKAKKETERAEILIDQNLKDASVNDKERYKAEFSRQLVSGSSIEDAEEHLINLMTRGSNEKIFSEINLRPFVDNDEAIQDKIDLIKEPEGFVIDLTEEGIDTNVATKIGDQIRDFARAADRTLKYILNVPDTGAEYGSEENVMGRTNLARAHALFSKLMMTPKEIIENEYVRETFDDIYIIDRTLSDYAKNERYGLGGAAGQETPGGVSSTLKDFDEDVKGPEVNEQTLQGGTEDTGFQEIGTKPSGGSTTTPRPKEKREQHDKDYQRRQRESGAYQAKLERDKKKLEADAERAAAHNERAFLDGTISRDNYNNSKRWLNLTRGRKLRGSDEYVEFENLAKLDSAIAKNTAKTRDLISKYVQKVTGSWFDEEEKKRRIVNMVAKLIGSLEKTKEKIDGSEKYASEVSTAIDSLIQNIPILTAQVKEKANKLDIPVREKDFKVRDGRKKRSDDLFRLIDMFAKYAETI